MKCPNCDNTCPHGLSSCPECNTCIKGQESSSAHVWSVLSNTFKREAPMCSADTYSLENAENQKLFNHVEKVVHEQQEAATKVTDDLKRIGLLGEQIANNLTDIEILFESAEKELTLAKSADLTLSILTMEQADVETVNMLFNMADDYLDDTSIESNFTPIHQAADTKQLESVNLQEQLKVTQSAITSNFINLKTSLAAINSNANLDVDNELRKLNLASETKILRAHLLDALFITTFAIFTFSLFMIFEKPYHWQILSGKQPLLFADSIVIVSLFTGFYLASTFLYFMLTLGVSAATFGMDIYSIKTVHRDYREHFSYELLARCVLLTANAFSPFWVASSIRKKSFTNWLTSSIYLSIEHN